MNPDEGCHIYGTICERAILDWKRSANFYFGNASQWAGRERMFIGAAGTRGQRTEALPAPHRVSDSVSSRSNLHSIQLCSAEPAFLLRAWRLALQPQLLPSRASSEPL